MSRPPEPLFLARRTYRRRRLGDAAIFLPALGLVLLLLPILWSETATTRGGLLYVFSVWAVLIAVVGPISMRLSAIANESDTPSDDEASPDQGAKDS